MPKSGKVKCQVCGEIFDSTHETCPVCGVGREYFVPIEGEIPQFKVEGSLHFVVLGGGVAALSAATAIRERAENAVITMVTDEEIPPYRRVLLAKQPLSVSQNHEFLQQSEQWYQANRIALRLGQTVTKLDTQTQTVSLDTGETLTYDKCIYALGARSTFPPIEGSELGRISTLRTLSDRNQIATWAKTSKRAVVIGGGVLGLEIAWLLAQDKIQVTVLERGAVPFGGGLSREALEQLTTAATQHGVEIKTEVAVEKLVGKDCVQGVVLQNASQYLADMVLVAAGVQANIAVAQGAGVVCERGIIVDQYLATNRKNLYACGDCVQYEGKLHPLWQIAAEMGRVAGANAVGENVLYQPSAPKKSFVGFGLEFVY